MLNFLKKKIVVKYKKKNFKIKNSKYSKKNSFYKKKYLKKNKYLLKKKRKKLNIFYKQLGLFSYSIFYKISNNIINIKKKNLNSIKKLQVSNVGEIESNVSKKIISSDLKKKPCKLILMFNLKINNIFINLITCKKKKKVIKFWSAGTLNINCSKKKIKFGITTLLKTLKIKLRRLKFYIILLKGPKYYVKVIYKSLKRFSYKSQYIIISSFKIFNGCRARKVKRKKHLKFQYFR